MHSNSLACQMRIIFSSSYFNDPTNEEMNKQC